MGTNNGKRDQASMLSLEVDDDSLKVKLDWVWLWKALSNAVPEEAAAHPPSLCVSGVAVELDASPAIPWCWS